MKPDPKKQKDKTILAYVRELQELHKIQRHAPLIKLAKPYQNGWTKFLVLRDDYTRRADAHVFLNILKVAGEECFCRKQNFLDRQGKQYGPGIRIIGKNEWEMLGWTEQYKKHFQYGRWRRENYFCYGWGSSMEGYKVTKSYFFVEAIKPHFITHTKTIYPDVEARIAFINNKFTHEQLWRRVDKLKGVRKQSRDYFEAKGIYLEKLGTKEIEQYDKSNES